MLCRAVSGATNTTVYTVPNGVRTTISAFTITNTSAGAVTVSINLADTAVAARNTILTAKSLASNESYVVKEAIGHTLLETDYISVVASAAGVIGIIVSGYEQV